MNLDLMKLTVMHMNQEILKICSESLKFDEINKPGCIMSSDELEFGEFELYPGSRSNSESRSFAS